MGVEGFIRLTEDLAEQASLEAGVPPVGIPTWPEPQRSGISMPGSLPSQTATASPTRDCGAAAGTSEVQLFGIGSCRTGVVFERVVERSLCRYSVRMATSSYASSQEDFESFTRMVRSRSSEHRKVMAFATEDNLLSTQMSTIREEVDSLLRVIYLLGINDYNELAEIIKNSFDQRTFGPTKTDGGTRRISDRSMIKAASEQFDWLETLYDFGCSFIHLTGLHSYQERDPFCMLSPSEREVIAGFLNHYYGGAISANSQFTEVAHYLPQIYRKVAENLEHLLGDLQEHVVELCQDAG